MTKVESRLPTEEELRHLIDLIESLTGTDDYEEACNNAFVSLGEALTQYEYNAISLNTPEGSRVAYLLGHAGDAVGIVQSMLTVVAEQVKLARDMLASELVVRGRTAKEHAAKPKQRP